MVSNKIKRCLSLVMALVLSFSLLPLGAMAAETEVVDTQSITEDTSPAEATESPNEEATEAIALSVEESKDSATTSTEEATENTALQSIQKKMNGILEYYLGNANLTAEVAVNLVAGLNPYDTAAAYMEIYELEYSDEFQALSDSKKQMLIDNNTVFCAFAEAISEKASRENAITTYAKTVEILDGQVTVTDSVGNGSASSGTVTLQAKGGYLSQTTNTITITINSGSKATLSFDYSASNYSTFSESTASGTKSELLDVNGTITMTIKGKKAISSNTATLTLSNFSLVAAKDASNVTFTFDSNYGTVTVAGTAISSGTTVEISASEGSALVATATNGATFYGWIDRSTGLILSTETSYTLSTGSDMTVEAVFIGTNSTKGYWSVAGASAKTFKNGFLSLTSHTYYEVSSTPAYLFDDLTKAAACAASSSSKYIVPLSSCTLSAGDYEIPSGVTLLIPFDDSNTLYTTAPQSTGSSNLTNPSAYRTLTLADGANLTVNGAMSISGKHCYTTASSYHGGSPSGKVGFVDMEEGSSITVNGDLYAYGYITGSGTVTANSGAEVYELFQIADFRGGTQTTGMENKVFPLSQYYIQNIEVPLTMSYGATEYCYTTVYMSSTQFSSAPILIGSGEGMFAMNSGCSVTKWYDGSTDRLCVEVNGSFSLSNVSLTMNGVTVDSSDYVLPISNNISVTVKSGSTTSIGEDIAMLPGSRVIIEEGATATLASGKSFYIYDADQWGNFCGSANKTYMPLSYIPGRTYNRQASDIVDALLQVDGTLDTSAGSFYTTTGTNVLVADNASVTNWTGGGANICSTGTGVVKITAAANTNTYQLVQATGYYMIPITSAKLKNADGTYVETSKAAGEMTFTYSDGFWRCAEHTYGEWTQTKAPTCAAAGERQQTCTVCGYVNTGEVAATGNHTGGTATCTTPAVCTVCGQSYGEPDPDNHTPGDPVVTYTVLPTYQSEGSYTSAVSCADCSTVISTSSGTAPKVAQLAAISASADAEVILQLKFYVPDDFGDGTITTKFRNEDPKTYSISNLTADASGRYVISEPIASGEMTQDVTVTFTNADGEDVKVRSGEEITPSIARSVVDYAELVLAKGSDAQKAVITALVTYGGYAQTHFDVDAENPAYSILGGTAPDLSGVTAETLKHEVTKSEAGIGITQTSQNAFLESSIYLRVFFTPDAGASMDGYTFELTYEVDHKSYTKALTPAADGSRYYVDITDIPAAYLDYLYTITVTNTETKETYAVETSVLAYLKDLLESSGATDSQRNLAKAMYLYNQATNTFFGK